MTQAVAVAGAGLTGAGWAGLSAARDTALAALVRMGREA
jgi:3-hydroxyacyl-CoA dehydrogenase